MPIFLEECDYRKKPKTVMINGVECPEAETEKPAMETDYYVVDLISGFSKYKWYESSRNNAYLAKKLIYLTAEDATLVSTALMKPLTNLNNE